MKPFSPAKGPSEFPRMPLKTRIRLMWRDWNPYYTCYEVARRVPYALAMAATSGVMAWLYLAATWAGPCTLNAKGTQATCGIMLPVIGGSGKYVGSYLSREYLDVPTWAHAGADIVWGLSWLVPFSMVVGAITVTCTHGPAAWAELKRRAGVTP